jgi:hypothetical protein
MAEKKEEWQAIASFAPLLPKTQGPFEAESLRSQHCYSHLQLTGP